MVNNMGDLVNKKVYVDLFQVKDLIRQILAILDKEEEEEDEKRIETWIH